MKANRAGSPVADTLFGDEPLGFELDLDSKFDDTLEFMLSDEELDDELRRRPSRRPPRTARPASRRGGPAGRPQRPPPSRSTRPGNRRPRPPRHPRPPRWPRRRHPMPLRPKHRRPIIIREPAPPCLCPAHGTEFVRWIQSALNQILRQRLQVDGVMNLATRSAIRRFQKEQGLLVDGIAGPETESALLKARSALNGRAPESIQSEMSEAQGLNGFEWDGERGGAQVSPTTLAAVPGIEKTSDAFRQNVIYIARGLGTDPNYLMAIMSFESGLDPKARNPYSGATGLIQFMPKTAVRLGTTIDALARMTAEKQLTYVQKYFAPYQGRLHTLEDAYMAVLWPPAIGRGNNYVLFASPSIAYEQNKALDLNKDGKITVAEATSFVRKRLGTVISSPRSSARPGSISNRSGRSKIRWVQRVLNRIMGLRLAEDGLLGPVTRSAIRSFQGRYGLFVDGIVGPLTEAKMISLGAGNPPGHARSVYTVPKTGGTSYTPSTPGLPTGAIVVSVSTNARVSENAIRVLKLILRDAGLTRAAITSGRRTSADQARIMYELIERDGVSYAKNLYGRYGDQVIAVYEAQKRAGRSPTAIKQAMEAKIKALGCKYISHHCSDEYDVIDVAPSSIADENAFRRALKTALKRGIIDKYIPPPEDPAFHIELQMKQQAN